MLKLTWQVPCSSFNDKRSGETRKVKPLTVSTISQRSSNQLGLLSSLKNRTESHNMNKIVCHSVEPGAPGGGGPFNSWPSWIFGIVVSLIIPFYRSKWGPLLAFKNRIDMMANTVEAVAEAVEKVAEKVEDIADDIGNNLPEGGKLRSTFDLIENIAKETAKDAHIVDQFIEKAEAMEDKVESLVENHFIASKKTAIVVEVVQPNTEDKSVVEKPSL